jgi:hypothetical protein
VLLSLEGEPFDVDLAPGDVGAAERPLDGRGHAGRAADEDVSAPEVGDELAEVREGEQPLPAREGVVADDVVDDDASVVSETLELLGEDDVLLGNDPVDDDRVTTELLEESTDRRDPDSARDQKRPGAALDGCREGAEWPFGHDTGPDRDRADP